MQCWEVSSASLTSACSCLEACPIQPLQSARGQSAKEVNSICMLTIWNKSTHDISNSQKCWNQTLFNGPGAPKLPSLVYTVRERDVSSNTLPAVCVGAQGHGMCCSEHIIAGTLECSVSEGLEQEKDVSLHKPQQLGKYMEFVTTIKPFWRVWRHERLCIKLSFSQAWPMPFAGQQLSSVNPRSSCAQFDYSSK